ncbi:hypothetical protein [Flavobacterium rhizosphaerae]|uniref:Uncharacterized protein n=1 Tax=Flavobacterium rhizosphaerae TaxID=3163298 RepID=A0ABW8YSZ7_9FLAO
MKNKIVLVVLLILPVTLYVYFSLAKHNSLFLPVLNKYVQELPQGETLNKQPVKLKGYITILGFLGDSVEQKKESVFNIDQKIYQSYKEFNDFQVVMVLPKGNEQKVQKLIQDFSVTSNISGWKFLFADKNDINSFYSSLKVKDPLSNAYGTTNVFIIDKDGNLRGRDGRNNNVKSDNYKDAYNSFSAAELHNEMTDDLKIVLQEYRLALRKNDTLKGVKREI